MIGKPPAELKCPACDTPLSQSQGIEGLCPSCLLELAMDDTSVEAEVLFEPAEAPTLQYSGYTFEEGQIQGERYRVRSLLGRGGMGEVWRAYDLKLRQDVALKALRTELIEDTEALETLRQEVRTAREVVSPNVCRVFDLQELDGQELVAMEYIDGTTLQEILRERSPLDLDEAREIASQFLAGLEAIHDAGLVHRDIKPENVMVTRTGRVVVMDFGIAKGLGSGKEGLIAGTPAYMAPEQSRGEELDARADVFSAGVVLAEMVEPGGVRSLEDRQRLWERVHREPPEVRETPWSRVIAECVAGAREARYATAAELARALEEVTLRAAGDETARPYPGLSAFQEEDAEYFYGRELEVEALWKKLRRPHLLAVIGPSGAGKSSFLHAGLLPALPEDWQAIIATPGSHPFGHLARALADELGDAPGVTDLLRRIDEPNIAGELIADWRQQSQHALIILDQFEELFTQNPGQVQERFAELLGALPLKTDVYVLLSMRDDFLMHCHQFEALRPIFSELSPLDPPLGAALRRALVQPALKCGYRFEEEAIVEEMLGEVEGQRGALPLLAFAAAQLWERRDRETGFLTRKSYEQIGGVGGALAQHAEAILDYIGEPNSPIVRELFRNLVTAQGTRAARDREDLLSVFPDAEGEPFLEPSRVQVTPAPPPGRPAANHVLNALIDARLLTSYEVVSADDKGPEPHHRIEIVHESLLASWPRLVRWRMQDAEGAQLRDELRHQARLWNEKGRPEDLLWTGTAFREYELWHERYPGGLTEVEAAFAKAMSSLAERRQRRRRMTLVATFVVLLGVLVIIGGLWRRSAVEAQRAEAANLFSLAQLRLEDHPTATVAYATASLELADNPEMRRLALEALWRGPTEFRLSTASPYSLDFSPDGRWLATADPYGGGRLWPTDGGPPRALEGSDAAMNIRISPRGDLVAANMDRERQELGFWSFPEGRFLRSFTLGSEGSTHVLQFSHDGERLFTTTEILAGQLCELEVRSWPVEGGKPDLIARFELPTSSYLTNSGVDPTGSRLSWADGRRVRIARLEGTVPYLASASSLEQDRTIEFQIFDQRRRQLATADTAGWIRIWSLEGESPGLIRTVGRTESAIGKLRVDPSGSMLAGMGGFLWRLDVAPDAEPLQLGSSASGLGLAFDPGSRWLATGGDSSVSLWPLARSYPQALRGHEDIIVAVAFTPDGNRLVSASRDGSVRAWPLASSSRERSRVLDQGEGVTAFAYRLAMAPDGSFVATGYPGGKVVVLPLDEQLPHELAGFTDVISALAVGPRSRLVAAGSGKYFREEAIVRVWNLESGEVRILGAGDGESIKRLEFTAEGDLWVYSGAMIRRWRVEGAEPRIVEDIDLSGPEFASDGLCDLDARSRQVLLRGQPDRLWVQHLDTYESRELHSHAGKVVLCRLDATGEIVVSSDTLGAVRIGRVSGEESHLLLGHEAEVYAVDLSPDGRWIASGGDDHTIRLWPMPDLSEPPLHTLSRDELLAKLRSLTNLKVVEDPDSPSGWKLGVGPFPGWQEVPTW